VATKPRPLAYTVCVKCSFPEAVLAFERFGENTYLCPKCQHVWSAHDGIEATPKLES
jgi:hypothetical protein